MKFLILLAAFATITTAFSIGGNINDWQDDAIIHSNYVKDAIGQGVLRSTWNNRFESPHISSKVLNLDGSVGMDHVPWWMMTRRSSLTNLNRFSTPNLLRGDAEFQLNHMPLSMMDLHLQRTPYVIGDNEDQIRWRMMGMKPQATLDMMGTDVSPQMEHMPWWLRRIISDRTGKDVSSVDHMGLLHRRTPMMTHPSSNVANLDVNSELYRLPLHLMSMRTPMMNRMLLTTPNMPWFMVNRKNPELNVMMHPNIADVEENSDLLHFPSHMISVKSPSPNMATLMMNKMHPMMSSMLHKDPRVGDMSHMPWWICRSMECLNQLKNQRSPLTMDMMHRVPLVNEMTDQRNSPFNGMDDRINGRLMGINHDLFLRDGRMLNRDLYNNNMENLGIFE